MEVYVIELGDVLFSGAYYQMLEHLEGKVLFLTLTRKWFDLIYSGEKTEEYREAKPYWVSRLSKGPWDMICFTNGYGAFSRSMIVEYKGLKTKNIEGLSI